MRKVLFTVENTFIKGNDDSNSLGISVYNRVFSKLVRSGGKLGKVHPIYLKINDAHLIFGILTLNVSGSYSFFPELPGKHEFDHMTFSGDLRKNNHHYTKTTFWKREKLLPIHAQLLSNGTYHATTFLYRDLFLLKNVPRHIIYPTVLYEDIPQIREAFITGRDPDGSTTIKIPAKSECVCFQFFLVPSHIHSTIITPYTDIITQIQMRLQIDDNTKVSNAVFNHPFQKNYRLGLLAFDCSGKLDHPLMICTSFQGNADRISFERIE